MATVPRIVASAQITKDPRVCGGKACIDNTRIRVIDIVHLESECYAPEQMQDVFAVPLTLAQIHLALAYAAAHPEETETAFAAGDQALQQIERDRAEHRRRMSDGEVMQALERLASRGDAFAYATENIKPER
jgi:uncharacterized protein (DUF433 family)